MTIFIDSNIFIAYANVRDDKHKKAVEIMEQIMRLDYGIPVTSDYIFNETVTVAMARTNDKQIGIKLGQKIVSSIRMIKVNGIIFSRAWKLFQAQDSALSFTDCTNIAFLEILKDNKIATFDTDFENVRGVKVVN